MLYSLKNLAHELLNAKKLAIYNIPLRMQYFVKKLVY